MPNHANMVVLCSVNGILDTSTRMPQAIVILCLDVTDQTLQIPSSWVSIM